MTLAKKIASDLKIDLLYIEKIIKYSDFYYKDYSIPKKNGGLRNISQASPELKTLQYWVVNNILSDFPVSTAAFAYKVGDSIKRHAEYHQASKYIFHTDIENFFLNINSTMLDDIIKRYPNGIYNMNLDLDEAIKTINKICFRKDQLCIGTVSSPIISNIVMNQFDETMITYCEEENITYSRYADDIYLSSATYLPNTIVKYIDDLLQKKGLKRNKVKTWFSSRKHRQKITGLVITTDGKISIGHTRKADIKKMVYEKLIHNKGDAERIIGYLSFLKDIEPQTYNNLIVKYSGYCNGDIIKAIKTM